MRRTAIWPWSESPPGSRFRPIAGIGGADSPRRWSPSPQRILMSHLDRGGSGSFERKRRFRRVTIEESGTPKRTGESIDGKLQGKRSGTGVKRASQHQACSAAGPAESGVATRGTRVAQRCLASDVDQSGRCRERPDGQSGRPAHQPLRGISRWSDHFQRASVLMGLTAYSDFQGFETSLSNLGMQIVDTNPTDGLIDGWLPINELPAAAQLPQTMSGQPDMRDVTYQAAINEADYST